MNPTSCLKKFIQSKDSIQEILQIFEELKESCELKQDDTGNICEKKNWIKFKVYQKVRESTFYDVQFKDFWKQLDKKFVEPPKNIEKKNLGKSKKKIKIKIQKIF